MAAGVNRADVLQRRGLYAPPADASPIIGLEVAGEVVATGSEVMSPRIGRARLRAANGGGYAGYCVAPAVQCLPWPRGCDAIVAAALPEACFTVWTNLFDQGRLVRGESLLVDGGASGIGVTAIRLAREFGGCSRPRVQREPPPGLTRRRDGDRPPPRGLPGVHPGDHGRPRRRRDPRHRRRPLFPAQPAMPRRRRTSRGDRSHAGGDGRALRPAHGHPAPARHHGLRAATPIDRGEKRHRPGVTRAGLADPRRGPCGAPRSRRVRPRRCRRRPPPHGVRRPHRQDRAARAE